MQVSYVMLYMQLVQKPKDLEGVCPFSDVTAVCPYGFACRYSGAHPEVKGVEVAEVLMETTRGKTPFPAFGSSTV
jgi:hypothetical protein